jgi:uncharacterized membrane protein
MIVGITHFIRPEQYARIVPPELSHPVALVYISGVFEILGGMYPFRGFSREKR